jgi:hypothetical protein
MFSDLHPRKSQGTSVKSPILVAPRILKWFLVWIRGLASEHACRLSTDVPRNVSGFP